MVNEESIYGKKQDKKITKLAFIHHSCGENWLKDEHGGLALALMANNYFVSSTNYGWGPDKIGDTTDIGHWWTWFRGPDSPVYLKALYELNDKNCNYSRFTDIPAGENEIIMFKSCYPNSAVKGDPADPLPDIKDNPLRGQPFSSPHHTLANIKSIYLDLLAFFSTRPDKLFIVITAPPLQDKKWSSNARLLNNWLVHDWLKTYPGHNVAVFDFFNILTSKDDLGLPSGNHHRVLGQVIEHLVDQDLASDTLKYPQAEKDDHPTAAGNQKATAEFIDFLNFIYNNWKNT